MLRIFYGNADGMKLRDEQHEKRKQTF